MKAPSDLLKLKKNIPNTTPQHNDACANENTSMSSREPTNHITETHSNHIPEREPEHYTNQCIPKISFWRIQAPGYTEIREAKEFKQIHTVVMDSNESICGREEKNDHSLFTMNNVMYSCNLNSKAQCKSTISSLEIKKTDLFKGRREVGLATLPNTTLSYTPGDSVLLKVSNRKERVDFILKSIQRKQNEWVSFRKVHIKTQKEVFSYEGTIENLFLHCLDITSLPSKYLLYRLSLEKNELSSESEDKEDHLRYFASKEGSKDYFRIGSSWNDLADILMQYRVQCRIETLLELCPEIKPRAFSMIQRKEEEVQFICGVIEKQEKTRNETRYGHFSSLFRDVESITQSSFVFPMQIKENRLMQLREGDGILIGVGTGISPFISFLRNAKDRQFLLFYGCSSKEENILFSLGIISGEGTPSEYEGAVEYHINNASIYVIYSQEYQKIRTDAFFSKNHSKISGVLNKIQQVYICGNKGARASLSSFFTHTYPTHTLYADDWV
ncbi:methionine synthase reductase [Nematocida sp. LUAm3]|nr:methionine synthase reductase [Nematocida sp. LUAm3]KAI5176317.1 methionine synthase reductase [Nematocida sp. LUAm2]KAI5178252.1 methionine synthase reductase [Nematocida sp. LUAm1]